MKRACTGKLNKTLDEVSGFITNQVNALTKDIFKSICGLIIFFLAIIGLKYKLVRYNFNRRFKSLYIYYGC